MEAVTIVVAIVVLVVLYYSTNNSNRRIKDIHDKYVLITGCDSGFGRKIAEQLDQLGVTVFAGCLTPKAVKELQEQSSRMIPFVLDVTNNRHISKAFSLIQSKLPNGRGLWGLINNAGIGPCSFIEWTSTNAIREVVEVNLFGLINVTTKFLPLIKKERGRIVNIASVAGVLPIPYAAAYVISKFGIVGFTGTLRLEMKPFGISVHCICPAFFRTAIVDSDVMIATLHRNFNALSDEVKSGYNEDFIPQMESNIKTTAASALTDLSPVTNAMENALFSTRPKSFYFVGENSWLWRIMCISPPSVSDMLTYKFDPMIANYCKGVKS